jgi:predicted NUDIX family NTP pyrophosphohydrolase
VLLITSRETKRWVIPKGNLIKGLDEHQAAAREAFEEAGISGIPCPSPLGQYRYDKRRKGGRIETARVQVFPLAVVTQFERWPEFDERDTRWFTLREAANAVNESELKALILSFREPPRTGLTERAISWARNKGGETIPMLKWFQRLMPQQGRFFDLFEAHAATLVAGADALACCRATTSPSTPALSTIASMMPMRSRARCCRMYGGFSSRRSIAARSPA